MTISVDGYEHIYKGSSCRPPLPEGSASLFVAPRCSSPVLLWSIPILLILLTSSSYLTGHLLASIPARGVIARPYVPLNEGGERCFAADSYWAALRGQQAVTIEDATFMGGMSAKSYVTHEGGARSVWKPQLAITNGRYSSPSNAVIAFHLDCLLGLQRTIPAAALAMDTQLVYDSLSDVSIERYANRKADWKKLFEEGEIFGAAQYYMPGVTNVDGAVHLLQQGLRMAGVLPVFEWLAGATPFTVRERADREMFDFLLANWDRSHNQFYVTDPETGISQLAFLDYDLLMLSARAPTVLNGKLTCQYYRSSVERLAWLSNLGLSRLLEQSLSRESHWPKSVKGKRKHVLRFVSLRASYFLEHVARCLEDHGEDYVFGNY